MSRVRVTEIPVSTSEETVREFFSFCGKIKAIDLRREEDTQCAIITFESAESVHTACMLDGGSLDGKTFHVVCHEMQSPPKAAPSEHQVEHQKHHVDAHHPIEQHDKPRAGIAAEYLARGYKLSDQALNRAIELDETHGISKKFLAYMNQLNLSVGHRVLGPDQTVSGKVQTTFIQARDRAKTIDEQKNVSKTAHEYYLKALASPLGQTVLSFYTSTVKQATDIHNEAKRINDHHNHPVAPSHPPPAASSDAPIKD